MITESEKFRKKNFVTLNLLLSGEKTYNQAMAKLSLFTRIRIGLAKLINVDDLIEQFSGGGGGRAISGKFVNEQSAMRIGAFYSCVKVIAETIATLPLHVFKAVEKGKVKATDHPLYWLLYARPNSWQTAVEFWELLVSHALISGNGYAYIARKWNVKTGTEFISELIPMHPDRVDVKQESDLSLTYTYTDREGKVRTLKQTDVLHLRGFGPGDGIKAGSLIAYAREILGKAIAIQDYSSRLFANDAKPGIVIHHPRTLSDTAYARIKEAHDSEYAGSENSHKTKILEEGMTMERLSFSAEDSQFIETSKLTRSEIAGLCRVPPHLIGDLDRATFSNIEEQGINLVTYCLLPWTVRIEQVLMRDLFTAPQIYYPKFNLEGLLRGNMANRYAAYAVARMWGWASSNDIRAKEDENGIGPQGDVYLSPQNMVDAMTLTLDLLRPKEKKPNEGGASNSN